MTIKTTCLSIDCPERKSLCCGAGSIATKRKDYLFACKNCGKEFEGGECNAMERIKTNLEEIIKLFPQIPENDNGAIYRKSIIAQELLNLRNFFEKL